MSVEAQIAPPSHLPGWLYWVGIQVYWIRDKCYEIANSNALKIFPLTLLKDALLYVKTVLQGIGDYLIGADDWLFVLKQNVDTVFTISWLVHQIAAISTDMFWFIYFPVYWLGYMILYRPEDPSTLGPAFKLWVQSYIYSITNWHYFFLKDPSTWLVQQLRGIRDWLIDFLNDPQGWITGYLKIISIDLGWIIANAPSWYLMMFYSLANWMPTFLCYPGIWFRNAIISYAPNVSLWLYEPIKTFRSFFAQILGISNQIWDHPLTYLQEYLLYSLNMEWDFCRSYVEHSVCDLIVKWI